VNRLEELRIQQMMRLGCVACAYIEIPMTAQECHHLLDGHRRLGHWFTIPLCSGHHRGAWSEEQQEVLGQLSIRERKNFLVAISDGRKAFTTIYPTERELWETVQERLGLLWPTSKILPRVVA
jgi:hypothetical protein